MAIAQVVPTRLVQGSASEVQIFTEEELDLQADYVLSKEPYGEILVGFGQIFSSKAFEEAFHYDGDDLGAVYTPERTRFRLWAPTASQVTLVTYPHSVAGLGRNTPWSGMSRAPGLPSWKDLRHLLHLSGYRGGRTNEAVDPYAKAVGVNGERGMVIDLSRTNPEGWEELVKPLPAPGGCGDLRAPCAGSVHAPCIGHHP